ncbi:hypothetical protein [Nocardioides sp.]|uniref:hypothetical protein n=1 Tax=Nocardioides sp. TaxID=35761 RepID=UPI0027323AFC|nr:hypothetical protein [Nocardioides sp.]MDP3892314.1 hypothetical protein [Nocardioides sp.]
MPRSSCEDANSDWEAPWVTYHRIINLTQRQAIEPTDAGALDKILEFGLQSASAMAALWLLLGREAWCGDRIAILGYEGRRGDLAAEVIAETGLDGTAYYDFSLGSSAQLAREVLVERGICSFDTLTSKGVELWYARPCPEVPRAGVDVVAANLDRGEVLDPAQFGDSRDLNLAAARGGYGGVTTALAAALAASNRGGSRGGGDLRSRDPFVGSWAGDRVGVVPVAQASDFIDVSAHVRTLLTEAGAARYDVSGGVVTRPQPT